MIPQGVKIYHELMSVGRAKYVVNYHDGHSRHRDGSPFYDTRIFSNRRGRDAFVRSLQAQGYMDGATCR